MPVDPDIAGALRAAALEDGRPLREVGPESLRLRYAVAGSETSSPLPVLAAIEELDLDGHDGRVSATIYRPRQVLANGPALIFIHGGGWVFGSRMSHDAICRALAAMSGVQLVSLEYPLAPEHPFPAAVDECWAATCNLLERAPDLGLDWRQIGVGGDSAGGNLAATIARRARDGDLPLACQFLFYPALSARCDSPSHEQFADGYGLTHDDMQWFWSLYLSGGRGRDDPEVSPLIGTDLGGLAPATVVTAEYDVLRDEAETYASRLAQAGVPTTLWRAPAMTHGFLRYRDVSAGVRTTYTVCARLLSQAFRASANGA